ncbi:MAG TPA: protein-L-isoaspartate(D-aspartate) O-methyltransferase [Candidatus Kapabacteria bacterium]|nr:protein-L-isoaspartate(D-aspartate) O-methyltransferase [Candidatus Kapabacteria bacterium]
MNFSAPHSGFTAMMRQTLVEQLRARGIHDERVLEAMASVPRERFLDQTFVLRAYEDSALPIGEGQTISQPYTVAYQTQELELKPSEKILEIGTGSGYQTAVLAQMGLRVFSIERHVALLEAARKRLESLGFHRVISRAGDGTRGWPEYAPFDAVLVTAGAPDVPESLAKQLSPDGGRMVIPIGGQRSQKMYLVKKNGEKLTATELADFAFVPLIGKEGWSV